jgi:hypothetical protein
MIGVGPVEPEFEEALLPADDREIAGLQPALNGLKEAPSARVKMSLARKM